MTRPLSQIPKSWEDNANVKMATYFVTDDIVLVQCPLAIRDIVCDFNHRGLVQQVHLGLVVRPRTKFQRAALPVEGKVSDVHLFFSRNMA